MANNSCYFIKTTTESYTPPESVPNWCKPWPMIQKVAMIETIISDQQRKNGGSQPAVKKFGFGNRSSCCLRRMIIQAKGLLQLEMNGTPIYINSMCAGPKMSMHDVSRGTSWLESKEEDKEGVNSDGTTTTYYVPFLLQGTCWSSGA